MERSGYQRELFRILDCGTTLMASGASDPGAAAGINCSYRSGYGCLRTGPSATADVEGVLSRVPSCALALCPASRSQARLRFAWQASLEVRRSRPVEGTA
jgi:hypothetical protein